jgi:hypothetical protein
VNAIFRLAVDLDGHQVGNTLNLLYIFFCEKIANASNSTGSGVKCERPPARILGIALCAGNNGAVFSHWRNRSRVVLRRREKNLTTGYV